MYFGGGRAEQGLAGGGGGGGVEVGRKARVLLFLLVIHFKN